MVTVGQERWTVKLGYSMLHRRLQNQFSGTLTGLRLPHEDVPSMVPVSEGSDRVITCGKIKLSSLFRSSRKRLQLGQDVQRVDIGGDAKPGTPATKLVKSSSRRKDLACAHTNGSVGDVEGKRVILSLSTPRLLPRRVHSFRYRGYLVHTAGSTAGSG